MKVFIYGKDKHLIASIISSVGLKQAKIGQATVIVSFGGDGTLLEAERKFPGVPKLMLRQRRICPRCLSQSYEKIIKDFKSKKYKLIKLIKLESSYQGRKMIGFNDVIVHNAIPTQAVRYQVFINNNLYTNEVIGDGVVVATPFGSGGYYRSITDSTFLTGIGLAFNNSTRQLDHIVLPEDSVIKVKILRGPALLGADNIKKLIKIKENGVVIIKKSRKFARVYNVPTLFCDDCRRGQTHQSQNIISGFNH